MRQALTASPANGSAIARAADVSLSGRKPLNLAGGLNDGSTA